MTKYTLLNRRMNNEIRISSRKAIATVIITLILFIYLLNKNSSCDNIKDTNQAATLDSDNLPIIYAITPTYNRPVQKAELTR